MGDPNWVLNLSGQAKNGEEEGEEAEEDLLGALNWDQAIAQILRISFRLLPRRFRQLLAW